MKYNDYVTELLQTKQLVLKRGTQEDFLKVYEYDFKWLKDIEGKTRLVKNDTNALKKTFIKNEGKYYSACKKAHMFDWIIYKENEPIGNIFTENEDLDNNSVYLSFNMYYEYWGKGYMLEVINTVLEYLYKIGYDTVYCKIVDGNKKAKRLLEKLSFKPYKILDDAYTTEKGYKLDEFEFSMEKEDWFSRTQRLRMSKYI